MLGARRDRLCDRLLGFVARPDSAAFDALATDVVAWQAEAIPDYGRLCAARGGVPDHWRKAPLCPTELMKELDLSWMPPGGAPAAVFRSSGTTVGRRSERRVWDLALYDAALEPPFVEAVLAGDRHRRPWLNLVPHPRSAPDSSLGHMVGRLADRFAAPRETAWVFDSRGLDVPAAWHWLESARRPIVLTATSFALANSGRAGTRGPVERAPFDKLRANGQGRR
jgi:hypothetical protein